MAKSREGVFGGCTGAGILVVLKEGGWEQLGGQIPVYVAGD